MIYISLRFILTLILMAVAVYLPLWFNRRQSKKDEYPVTFEYMSFTLEKEEQSSWEELNTLGADGWEIAFNIDESYKSYFFILKRETFHQT